MIDRWEPAHVRTDLRDQDARGGLADAEHRREEANPRFKAVSD
jgi:hypothetical protein